LVPPGVGISRVALSAASVAASSPKKSVHLPMVLADLAAAE
jgi:hypothetical protein